MSVPAAVHASTHEGFSSSGGHECKAGVTFAEREKGMGDLQPGLPLESLTGPCSRHDKVRVEGTGAGLGWVVSHCVPVIPDASRANPSLSQAPHVCPMSEGFLRQVSS